MRQGALLDRCQLFLAAAVLAAHASHPPAGFRQRDVHFLVRLFLNWTEHTLGRSSFGLQNAHLHRFLEQLVRDGFARVQRRGRQPLYTLTRVGLLELAQRVAADEPESGPSEFLFRCYFLRSYRQRVVELVQREGKQFPASVRLELEALLDVEELLRRERRRVALELKKLEDRIQSCNDAANLARRRFAQGASYVEVAQETAAKFPYELNSEKPMSELFDQLPEDIARWEMEEGHVMRVSQLWKPSLALLRSYEQQLRALAE